MIVTLLLCMPYLLAVAPCLVPRRYPIAIDAGSAGDPLTRSPIFLTED